MKRFLTACLFLITWSGVITAQKANTDARIAEVDALAQEAFATFQRLWIGMGTHGI